MATRRIVTVPDPVLRVMCRRVQDPRATEIHELIRDLKETVIVAEGIGLAAPQVGSELRVIVIHYGTPPFGLINPEVTFASRATSVLNEGCLSIPGVVVPVRRPRKVRVRAINERGELAEISADDLLAKILQHEIDHLNGVLITDYQELPH